MKRNSRTTAVRNTLQDFSTEDVVFIFMLMGATVFLTLGVVFILRLRALGWTL